LRFTGVVVRRTAEQHRLAYDRTSTIQLLSTLVPAILTGNANAPVDFGNACGMCLMDYKSRQWSLPLTKAVSAGLPGDLPALTRKLVPIVAPDAIVGTVAPYFVMKYGLSAECRIAAGSGDNPQSKVMVHGDLLSLGSSFVNMVSTDGRTMDMTGSACAMYDGVGRPFMFGCRTNGALVWDRVRALYGLKKEDYAPAEAALRQAPLGRSLVFWQPRGESFPASGSFELTRASGETPGMNADYAGIVESSLAAVYLHSRAFSVRDELPLHVTGGATASSGVMRRIAAIWNRPVIVTESGGAALGAAVAGISALLKSEGRDVDVEDLSKAVIRRGELIQPAPQDAAAFHSPGGYLDRFAGMEARLLQRYPLV
jgi:xylulokinase